MIVAAPPFGSPLATACHRALNGSRLAAWIHKRSPHRSSPKLARTLHPWVAVAVV